MGNLHSDNSDLDPSPAPVNLNLESIINVVVRIFPETHSLLGAM